MSEAPVPFITLDDKLKKFVIGEEAVKVLSSIKGKVAVVSVAGLYRTGKSYILNRVLGRQKGFEVGSTVNSCTRGIYIWGKPLSVKNADGIDVSVVVIDTEGIGSVDKDATYDAKIFSFAVLLSSFFVYNSMGIIDETAMEKLSFIANLTKHIHAFSETKHEETKDKKGKERKVALSSLSPYFPTFLWLLRDFALKLVDKENNPISSREYLENALHTPSKDVSKNEIRESILQVFTNRDCMTLCRPVEDEDDLQNLDNIEYDKLREKFRSGMTQVAEKIFKEIQPKYVYGKPINGQAFVTLAKSYVDAINSGSVPTIQNAWQNVSELECQHGVEAAVELYLKLMTEATLPLNVEDFLNLHEKSFSEALNVYKASALGESSEEYREKLDKQLKDHFQAFQKKNAEASETRCKELLASLYSELDKRVQAKEFKTGHELKEAWKRLQDAYFAKALGPAVYRVLSSFLIERLPDSLVTVNESQLADQKKEFEEVKTDLKSQIARNNKQIDDLLELAESRKKEKEEADKQNQLLKNEIQELKTKLAALEGEKKEALTILSEGDKDLLSNVQGRKKRKCSIM